MTYQIRDWNEHFENNKSKERDRCSFVCVPNKQHGMGFCRLMAEPDGAAIYGIWHCILGACSQQKRPREGWLTSDGRAPDGHRTGTSWAPLDLSLKFRRPEAEIKRALDVLCSESIGWVVLHGECPSGARPVPAECPSGAQEGKGRERNEGKGREDAHADYAEVPILEEIRAYGGTIGATEETCRNFFNHHQNQNVWLNKFGRLIDWRHKLQTWRDDDRTKPRNGTKNIGGIDPNYVDCGTACARADASRAKRDAQLKVAPFVPHNPRQFTQDQ